MNNLIISSSKDGRLGNRILIFANFIAFAAEHKLRVINPSFEQYAEFFQSTSKDLLCCYPAPPLKIRSAKITRKLYRRFFEYLSDKRLLNTIKVDGILNQTKKGRNPSFNLSNPEIISRVKETKFTLFSGALYRDPWYQGDKQNMAKHAELIREYFVPLECYENKVSTLIEKLRRDAEVLVGIHIRHGDYKQAKGGQLYFSPEQYAKVMRDFQNLFSGKKIKFLICSDAQQPQEVFQNFDYSFGNGHLIEDMYSFSRCDYIIGAPSTYTLWAAFYGDKPIYQIINPNKELEINDFIYPYH